MLLQINISFVSSELLWANLNCIVKLYMYQHWNLIKAMLIIQKAQKNFSLDTYFLKHVTANSPNVYQ